MESPESPPDLLAAYTATLETKAPSTVDVYTRILRQFTVWLAARPGSSGVFQPDQLTVTALDTYLKEREASGVSISHRTRIKGHDQHSCGQPPCFPNCPGGVRNEKPHATWTIRS